jgi:hypothetical protein
MQLWGGSSFFQTTDQIDDQFFFFHINSPHKRSESEMQGFVRVALLFATVAGVYSFNSMYSVNRFISYGAKRSVSNGLIHLKAQADFSRREALFTLASALLLPSAAHAVSLYRLNA